MSDVDVGRGPAAASSKLKAVEAGGGRKKVQEQPHWFGRYVRYGLQGKNLG